MEAVARVGQLRGDDRGRLLFTSLAAAMAMTLAQLADITTFLVMISAGGLAAEANPIVGHIGAELGIGSLVVIKIATTGFAAVTFALLSRMSSSLAGAVLTAGTLTGLLGALSNVLAFS